jgi:CheY-like chemotaxis protein/HPt (histidine-containing phosphotransfer) domain-containing protein
MPHMTPRQTTSVPRGLRLLVVEDNTINQRVLTGLLARLGHSAVVAGNGRAALEMLGREDFDGVLMDVQMPEMDGLETTAHIRHAERNAGRHLPIIALTAHAMTGDRERCLAAGMDGYLAKPIDPDALAAALAALVSVVPTADPATDAAGSPTGLVYDRDTALRQVGGDAVLLKELIGIFLDNEARWRDDLREAAAAGDLDRLRRTAHMLRGATATLGGETATMAAEHLEQRAGAGDATGTAQALTYLEQTLVRLTDALRAGDAPFSEDRS